MKHYGKCNFFDEDLTSVIVREAGAAIVYFARNDGIEIASFFHLLTQVLLAVYPAAGIAIQTPCCK